MSGLPQRLDLALAELLAAAREVPREAQKDLLLDLERVKLEILYAGTSGPVAPPPPAPRPLAIPPPVADVELTPAQVAKRLGISRWSVYQLRHSLPRTCRPSGRWTVSSRRLDEWRQKRTRGPAA